MATKDDMIKEMLVVHDDFSNVFEEAKIDRLKFFKYIHGFVKYPSLRRAHSYAIRELALRAEIANDVYKRFKPKVWTGMKIHAKSQKDVVELREVIGDLKNTWSNKPRVPRKGSE